MDSPRLYYGPKNTTRVLRQVIKGATTTEDLAEELNLSSRTIHNRVHDPAALGLIDRSQEEYKISNKKEVLKLFQLEDKTVLETRFLDLPGVEEVRDELNGGRITFERIGRLISFHTNSEAIEKETFVTYGRIYADWFEYLQLGYAYNGTLYSERPPEAELKEQAVSRGPGATGSGYPKVRQEKVFKALPLFKEGISDKEEISESFEFSDRYAGKLISTCYSLGLTERKKGEIVLTNFGERVLEADEEGRKDLIKKALRDVDLVEQYIEIAPNQEFSNKEVMKEVSQELEKGWSDSTIQTKAKRLYSWLTYSGLFIERKRGWLIPNPAEQAKEIERGQASLNDV